MPIPLTDPSEVHRTLLRDEVHARLLDAIIDGTLEPGEFLRDKELAHWLQTSRTPIREALGRLETMGLVEMVPNRFTRVTPIDPLPLQESLETLGFLIQGALVEERKGSTRSHLQALPAIFGAPSECIDHFWALTLSILGSRNNQVLLHSASNLYPTLGRAFKIGASYADIHGYQTRVTDYLAVSEPTTCQSVILYRQLGEIMLDGCQRSLKYQTFVTNM